MLLSETWLTDCDVKITNMMDSAICSLSKPLLDTGFGENVRVVSPLIKYEKVTKMVPKNVQSIRIVMRGVTVTEVYIAPNTEEEEEMQFL